MSSLSNNGHIAFGKTWLTPEAVELLPKVDSLIFDIDGVLIDITDSIRAVNSLTADYYFGQIQNWGPTEGLLLSSDVELFKNAGGFNNDWELSNAVAILYLYKWFHYGKTTVAELRALKPTIPEYTDEIAKRGGWLKAAVSIIEELATPGEFQQIKQHWNPELIVQIFQELFAGDLCKELYHFEPSLLDHSTHRGLIYKDRPIVNLSKLPSHLNLGVVTGRCLTEAVAALRLIGMSGLLPANHMVTDDDGIKKPHPRILQKVADRMGTHVGIYVGDTLDDLRTVQLHQAQQQEGDATIISCQVLTGPGGHTTPELFAEHKAEIIAESVNDLFDLLQTKR
jgi:HAD superfamily hydrolase (TIGR01548 family)